MLEQTLTAGKKRSKYETLGQIVKKRLKTIILLFHWLHDMLQVSFMCYFVNTLTICMYKTCHAWRIIKWISETVINNLIFVGLKMNSWSLS